MFLVSLFIQKKGSISMPINDEQMWYIHIMKFYSITRGNEVLIHVAILMNLTNITLSESSQSQNGA